MFSVLSTQIALLLIASFNAAAELRPLRPQSDPGRPLLVHRDNRELKIAWTNSLLVSEYVQRQNLLNGSGVALGDYDGDGRCDIFLCGKFAPSALYRNLGEWRFEDATVRAGVSCPGQITTGAVFADYDGDNRLDLFVTSFLGPNACFRNLGDGTFKDVTDEVGLRSPGGATSMALADFDGDGDLDLYVNYFGIEALLRDGVEFRTRMVGGRTVVTGRYARRLSIVDGVINESGEPDRIYRNDGGKFTALKWEDFFVDEEGKPVAAPLDFGLAVQIRDVDLDGDPDIYTCNDFQTPDRLWLNDGRGKFRAIAPLALRNRSHASMGVDFADIDRDGDLDFVTVEMLSRAPERSLRQSSPMSPTVRTIGEIMQREDVARNGLYLNRGDGTYAELAWFAGVAASDWSWTPIFADVDLDGYEDLLISNGHLHDVNDRDSAVRAAGVKATQEMKRQLLVQYPRLDPPKAAFRNRGDATFEDAGEMWGFNSRLIVHGMALGDLDGDGDQDVVGNALNTGPMIYENNSAKPRVAVRLRGKAPNTRGIGARVTLRSNRLVQMQEMLAGGRYLSGDDALRVFAVPESGGPLTIEVNWRNGTVSRAEGVKENSLYEIGEEESAVSATAPSEARPQPLFEDASALLKHTHHEVPFDDFARQPLLPRRYSQLGPGLAWFDWDGDGRDELIVGSGRGGAVHLLRNSGQNFKTEVLGKTALPDDTTAIVGSFIDGEPVVLMGQSHYESGRTNAAVEIVGKTKTASLPALENNSSAGAIAVADVDGDGDLDVFVGGRIVPGNYPAPPSSALYRLEGAAFVRDDEASKTIRADGMITGAIFSDLDADGFPELIRVEEWGPVRIYRNERGQFSRRTEAESPPGFWNSVTTGDLNGDGRLDIVAGNIGRNNRIARGARTGQWSLYYDFDPGVNGELLETYTQKRLVLMRDLQTLSRAIPSLGGIFPSHEAFAKADMQKALAQYWSQARSVTATLADSVIFWNEGAKGWRTQALPDEAQWAPAFGLNVADFDHDGWEDLFVAQNFFAVRPEDDREDAGRGLLLRGSKSGALSPLSGAASGITVYGEQRGSAVSDFDGDGRLDLAVSQNGTETKLYRNTGAPSGLRIRLKGPPGNPLGYGATLRVKSTGDWGPAREIHGGSGYWSQDSAVQLFAPNAREVSILWPGGKRTVSRIPDGAAEIVIDQDGNCSRLK
jgi:enediyne biosynthesis protein E4